MEDFTAEEIEQLKEYSEKIKQIEGKSAKLKGVIAEEWDEFFEELERRGTFPERFKDRIGQNIHIEQGKEKIGYYDIAKEKINNELLSIYAEYNKVIKKFIVNQTPIKSKAPTTEEQTTTTLLEEIDGFISKNTDILPEISEAIIKSFFLPRDKINKNVWDMVEDTKGQYQLKVNTAPADLASVISYCAVSFPDDAISKKLTPYDKRVYCAIASIYNQQGSVMTLQQIFHCMGGASDLTKASREKLEKSIKKMMTILISVNNSEEIANGFEYPLIEINSNLLYAKLGKVAYKKLFFGGLQLFEEPCLFKYARERKETYRISADILQAPRSLTDANIMLEDYLLTEINRMRHNRNSKIKYTTLFENIGAAGKDDKMKRKRAKEMLFKYLEFYKQKNAIKDYKEEKDGVTIFQA